MSDKTSLDTAALDEIIDKQIDIKTDKPSDKISSHKLSRRELLGSAATAGSLSLLPVKSVKSQVVAAPQAFSDEIHAVLVAFTGRIIPADENGPGAIEAGAANYINRALSEWNSNELTTIRGGLINLNNTANNVFDADFQALSTEQQDELLTAMDEGQIAGFSNASQVFNRLQRLTLEGTFSDPYYGGNQNYIGWDLIGYPGAVMGSAPEMQEMGGRLPPIHTSAYGGDYDGE
jgi:gluconate 2-dehydrogenase gamma chain